MPIMAKQVTAPPVEPIKFDLLDTIDVLPMPDHGALGGVQYDTEFCGIARPWVNPCVDPGVQEKVADDGIDQTEGVPIPVYHLFSCRLVDSEDPVARARRALELGASRAVEEGFGQVIGAAATDITPGGTAQKVKVGLALLEQHAGENYGGRAVIHMSRATAILAIGEGLIHIVDGHLETFLGSLVIAGAGYGDLQVPSAPAAGAEWMYATGAVHVWSQNIEITELVLDTPYTNEFKALAESVYVPTYECFAAAVEVSLEA